MIVHVDLFDLIAAGIVLLFFVVAFIIAIKQDRKKLKVRKDASRENPLQ